MATLVVIGASLMFRIHLLAGAPLCLLGLALMVARGVTNKEGLWSSVNQGLAVGLQAPLLLAPAPVTDRCTCCRDLPVPGLPAV